MSTTRAARLAPREMELLRLLADGHSVASAAANMRLDYDAAKSMLARTHRKTGHNTYKLVAIVAVRDYRDKLIRQRYGEIE